MKKAPTKLPRVQAASEANIIQIRQEANTLAQSVEEFSVKTSNDVVQATEILGHIKKAINHIEEQQRSVISHLQDLMKIERERWAPSLDLLNASNEKLRSEILQFRQIEQANAKKEEAKILKAVASGKLKETTAMKKLNTIESVGKSVNSFGATASFRSIQKLVIDDETKIPREFLVPDEKKIKAALKAGSNVAGCHIVVEETLAIK